MKEVTIKWYAIDDTGSEKEYFIHKLGDVKVAAMRAQMPNTKDPTKERYVHLEAGHVAQNVLLEATALGLAGVPVGAFSDAGIQQTLGLPSDHAPLYLLPIGHSAEG